MITHSEARNTNRQKFKTLLYLSIGIAVSYRFERNSVNLAGVGAESESEPESVPESKSESESEPESIF